MDSSSKRPGGINRVLVAGSANMDLVFGTDRLPKPGETILGHSFATHPGGKGANQAVAAAKLGSPVSFVGKVGNDVFGDVLAESIGSYGVDLAYLQRTETATGTACILVDRNGQNSIVVAPGANAELAPSEVAAAIEELRPTVVLTQLETNLEVVRSIRPSADRSFFFILNPAPSGPLPDEVLASADLVTPNELETEAMVGILPGDDASCLLAAARLFDRGAKAAIFTLGARGSFYADPAGGRHYPTLNVRAIDTTAAGDAFNGALAAFLAEGRDLANAIPLANCVGALSTTKAGAQGSIPTRDELREVADALL
ncbi:MAG TPA: ribokinase [Fimbriimonas sp.]